MPRLSDAVRSKILFFLGWLACFSALAENFPAPDILKNLRPDHPRLIVTAAEWKILRAEYSDHGKISEISDEIIAEARTIVDAPPLVYKKDGKRLLAVSREAMRRIVFCGFAYQLTGEKKFLERAQADMLAAAAFNDWNPSHFLDTAEMTAALALGYDWLFDSLPASARATIHRAILEKGIKAAFLPHNSWQTLDNNWNQVCFGGLTLGALAIADENPDVAGKFLALAKKNNPNGLKPYSPDGIFPEGPGYWNYGTSYEVLMLSALQTALGTDWDLSAQPGFMISAATLVEQTGPTGRPFNFSDGGDEVAFNPAMFWFAQKLHQPRLVYFTDQLLPQFLSAVKKDSETERFFPFLAIWADGLPQKISPPDLPLAWHGDGPNPIGIFRSSWTDTNALFLAFKGGSAKLSHAHMDAGSFVLDAEGVRWACDLGSQDYLSIESKGWNLWSSAQNSDRWRVYRLNNFSHNTLTLDGQLHNVAGDARISAFATNSATVNLDQIFAGQADHVTRQFFVGENKKVQIRDEISGAKPGLSVRWQMLTHAKISSQKNQAVLRQNGKTLIAKILSPADARFEILQAQPPNDGVNQPNPNTRILAVNLNVPASGNLIIEIELQPETASRRQQN
jgi:hypothetical protein